MKISKAILKQHLTCLLTSCLLTIPLTVAHADAPESPLPGDSESPLPWGPQPDMTPATEAKSPKILPFRSWQLHNDDGMVEDKIRAAADYDITNIQLSHNLVMFSHKLLEEPERVERYNRYIELAHSLGMSVHIWGKEFAGIDEEITQHENWFDRPELWDFIDARYEALFEAMPKLDGMVLTLHETSILIFDIDSVLPVHERVAKLANRIHAVFKKHGKTLVVRTFAHKPGEVTDLTRAIKYYDPEIVLMSKCVPHDWEVFYPHNPAIGQYPDRKLIIEFDPGAEYYGVGHVPYLYPEYLAFRLDYARNRNAQGYVARIEREGDNPVALRGFSKNSGFNEINLYALKRLAEDPDVTPDQIWREYITEDVGEGAHVEPLIEALKLTDDVLNRCYFMLGCWYNNHSRLPSEGYAKTRIRRIAGWHPEYEELVSRLDTPDARTVGEVMRESATAVIMARQALGKLEEAKSAGLGDSHYERYRHQLDILLETAELWAEHRNAFIKGRSGGLAPSFDGPFPVGGPPRHPIIPSGTD